MKKKRLTLDIQRFGDGMGNGAEVSNNSSEASNNSSESENRAAGENTGEEGFEGLINGKYKKEFSEKVQSIIDKRFKKTKELEAFYEGASPSLTLIPFLTSLKNSSLSRSSLRMSKSG